MEKSKKGFASMDPAKQKEIAAKGGKAAHEQGVAHRWTPTEASKAGKKGVENKRSKKSLSESEASLKECLDHNVG